MEGGTCEVCGRRIRYAARRGGYLVRDAEVIDDELLCRACADRHHAWKYQRLLERERALGHYDR